MAVVEYDLGAVPLPCRLEVPGLEVRDVHGVVYTAALPRFEDIAVVHLGEVLVVDELVLRAGHIRDIEAFALHDMVHHAAVATLADLPFPFEIEVGVFLVSHYVAVLVAALAFGLDCAVHDGPGASKGGSIIIPPAIQCVTVEKELPSFGLLL